MKRIDGVGCIERCSRCTGVQSSGRSSRRGGRSNKSRCFLCSMERTRQVFRPTFVTPHPTGPTKHDAEDGIQAILSFALGTRPLSCGVGSIGRLGAMTLVTSCRFSGVPRCQAGPCRQAGVGAGHGRPKWGRSTASTERRFPV